MENKKTDGKGQYILTQSQTKPEFAKPKEELKKLILRSTTAAFSLFKKEIAGK